jgi:hypothetical protein
MVVYLHGRLEVTGLDAMGSMSAATQPCRMLDRDAHQIRIEELNELLIHQPHL